MCKQISIRLPKMNKNEHRLIIYVVLAHIACQHSCLFHPFIQSPLLLIICGGYCRLNIQKWECHQFIRSCQADFQRIIRIMVSSGATISPWWFLAAAAMNSGSWRAINWQSCRCFYYSKIMDKFTVLNKWSVVVTGLPLFILPITFVHLWSI